MAIEVEQGSKWLDRNDRKTNYLRVKRQSGQ